MGYMFIVNENIFGQRFGGKYYVLGGYYNFLIIWIQFLLNIFFFFDLILNLNEMGLVNCDVIKVVNCYLRVYIYNFL